MRYSKTMGRMDSSARKLVALLVVSWFALGSDAGGLAYGFYDVTCPLGVPIVRAMVLQAISRDPGVGAGLLRLHFVDCFVRGCDGSVLIDSTPSNLAEKDSPVYNGSLRGFEVIDKAKVALEAQCPGVVSCADILALAARDSVVALALGSEFRGYRVRTGRRDGRVSLSSETLTEIPSPSSNLQQLIRAFSGKGLSGKDLVVLSGAHTVGRSHCNSFSDRLYNFNSTTQPDPSLDPDYMRQLRLKCPQGSTDTSIVVPLDGQTPFGYYANVLNNRGLFTSDQALLSSQNTADMVSMFRGDRVGWRRIFATALQKMGQIDALTGTDGEIRKNCRKIN